MTLEHKILRIHHKLQGEFWTIQCHHTTTWLASVMDDTYIWDFISISHCIVEL